MKKYRTICLFAKILKTYLFYILTIYFKMYETDLNALCVLNAAQFFFLLDVVYLNVIEQIQTVTSEP